MNASDNMQEYFKNIEKEIEISYTFAEIARKKGYDPEDKVDIPLARGISQRVEGLISAVSPQILKSGVAERIEELEKEYGSLDWRVALKIAEEVSKQKFCKFNDEREAMEVAIRVGLAYITLGVIAAPLEGFIELKIKNTKNGEKYLSAFFAGPIRAAGGTAAAVTALIADYVRIKMGYAKYDPSENEIKRYIAEIQDYHERITNLQYFPSIEEIEFLAKNLPIEINGDPTEELEVSNYKGLDRVETDRIRGGMCLVMAEGVAQKSPKMYKQIAKWGKSMDLDWDWMKTFLDLQKIIKAKGNVKDSNKEKPKISPNFTYIKDLVAGRPVLSYPLTPGGFRLRYGRTRTSGFAADSIHPATMLVLEDYIATGTQLKVERPGKATVLSPCDYIDGPIIKLINGDVLKIDSEEEIRPLLKNINKILFLGDILVNYGDFSENGHTLVPAGYCEEWWIQELEKKSKELFGNYDIKKLEETTGVNHLIFENILKDSIKTKITFNEAFLISEKLAIPLHPTHTYYYNNISKDEFKEIIDKKKYFEIIKEEKIIKKIIIKNEETIKTSLEKLGLPHKLASNEFIVIEKCVAESFYKIIGEEKNIDLSSLIFDVKNTLDIINNISKVLIKDKLGTFIGTRMGRPEKAKERALTGSPHVLFPVGDEGGKLKTFQTAMEKGKVTSDFPIYKCNQCNKQTILPVCEICESKTQKIFFCKICGLLNQKCTKRDEKKEHYSTPYRSQSIDIKYYFEKTLQKAKIKNYPEIIKGVKGTLNKNHEPEYLLKGILRAKHNIHVNKDGTTRYDMIEMPITHFKANEIGVSIEKLIKLGYKKDIYGKDLENEDQIIELFAQDIILPDCPESPDEYSSAVLIRVCNFIDDELMILYGQKSFYNVKRKEDLIGQLVIGLAPHTSAGMVGRILGFSKTQGMYCHPMFHAAMRRNCFDYDTTIPIIKNNKIEIVKIGEYVEKLNPKNIIDSFGTKEIKSSNEYTFGFDKETNKLKKVKINNFTKHKKDKHLLKITMQSGREIKTTLDHKFLVYKKNNLITKKANELLINDMFLTSNKINLNFINKIKEYNLIEMFSSEKNLMIRNISKFILPLIKKIDINAIIKNINISLKDLTNYRLRDSYPIDFVKQILNKNNMDLTDIPINAKVGIKRDNISINSIIKINDDLLELFGLYIAEGFCRENNSKKGFYQMSIASIDKNIREKLIKTMKNSFGVLPSEHHKDHVTFSSKIINKLFTEKLKLGHNAKTKRIPGEMLSFDKKRLARILAGFYEGDGSVSKTDLRVTCDSVSDMLIADLEFALSRFNIFTRKLKSERIASGILKEFYSKKNKALPKFKSTKLTIPSDYVKIYYNNIGFISKRKKDILKFIVQHKKSRGMKLKKLNDNIVIDKIKKIEMKNPKTTYCLNVEGNIVLANNIITKQCDGDEACVMMLQDALLNFSRTFLPDRRGSRTMDAPLVLTSILIPAEVDSEVHGLDIVWSYPLELYEAALEYKNPWDVKVRQIGQVLGKNEQYEGMGFTHHTTNMNAGVRCSSYKTLPSMEDKLKGQMSLAEKISAVDESDVARLVIEKHFMKDIKGNLRKFSQQEFRCVGCNEKYRRPPLVGVCTTCGGKIIFTISEGSIIKYLEPAISLGQKYNVSPYLKESLELVRRRVEEVFGKDAEKQTGLGAWFG